MAFLQHHRAIHSSDLFVQTADVDAMATASANKAKAKSLNRKIINAAQSSRKMVRFADSFGFDLEKVKLITNSSFDAFNQAPYELDSDSGDGTSDDPTTGNNNSTSSSSSKPFLVLIPLFGIKKNSTNESSLIMLKLDDYVFDYENKMIKCIIKVKNVSFEKRVFARISFNNWKTFYDLDAIFIRSDAGNSLKMSSSPSQSQAVFGFDYFGFCIVIPDKSSSSPPSSINENSVASGSTGTAPTHPLDDCIVRIEFALCYQVGVDDSAQSYWDNNGGENYKFQCFFNKTN